MKHDDADHPANTAQKRGSALRYFRFFANRFRQIEDPLIECSREHLEKAVDFEQIGRFVARAYGKSWDTIRTDKAIEKNKEFYEKFMKTL